VPDRIDKLDSCCNPDGGRLDGRAVKKSPFCLAHNFSSIGGRNISIGFLRIADIPRDFRIFQVLSATQQTGNTKQACSRLKFSIRVSIHRFFPDAFWQVYETLAVFTCTPILPSNLHKESVPTILSGKILLRQLGRESSRSCSAAAVSYICGLSKTAYILSCASCRSRSSKRRILVSILRGRVFPATAWRVSGGMFLYECVTGSFFQTPCTFIKNRFPPDRLQRFGKEIPENEKRVYAGRFEQLSAKCAIRFPGTT